MDTSNLPKIAFLIVAHTNPTQLNKFIEQLLAYEKSYIYIHIDAKGTDMIPHIIASDRVKILPQHFDVQWGDYTQILVNNYLLSYAQSQGHHDFYSLHSGTDMAIRPVVDLASYLSRTNAFGYYDCTALPNGWQYGGGLGRLALYWPRFFRRRLSKYSPLRILRSLYGRLYGFGIIKGKPLPKEYQLYGGADWFTVSSDCVDEMFEFLKSHPDFESLFINSLSGAEIYYVSLFELLKGSRHSEFSNMLRYVDWKERGQNLPVGSPNTCSMSFLSDIEQSQMFFARKFDAKVDSEIVEYFLSKCTDNKC